MRTIKFRAWDKVEDRMVALNSLDFPFDRPSGKHLSVEALEGNEWRSINEVELMQYTGLKDKNGVEIYEGDVLEIKPNYLFQIIWHEESWGYKVIKNDAMPVCGYIKGYVSRGGLKHYNNGSPIIGNIYENPELLEGEK